ncbi:MAG: hypothetical protein KBS55_00310 [Bacteroidales bacterium]|nr:hypothetical protein [Candidatus Cryptobacteroides aphodequi]
MKTRLHIFALIPALLLAGCAEEPFTAPAPEELAAAENEITFLVQREPDCVSRAVLGSDLGISFQAGDKISIFDGDGINTEFTQYGSIAEDGSTSFRGRVKFTTSSYLALYPYTPGVETDGTMVGIPDTDRTKRIYIPSEQKAVAGSFDPKAFISVAKSVKTGQNTHKLTFHTACALVKFTIPEEAGDFVFEKAVLKTVTSGLLAGGIGVDKDGIRTWLGTGSGSITLTGAIKAGQSYYICTDPRTVEGLSLSLYHYSSDETPFVVKETEATREVTLVRNKVLDLGEIELGTLPEKTAGWYGSGTAADPYQISTLDDLKLFLNRLSDDSNYRSLCFRLSDDIDCQGDSLQVHNSQPEFCGTLDGNGHCISNYLLTKHVEIYQGIKYFYSLIYRAYGATFKNLVLRPADDMYFKWGDRLRVSFLVGTADEHSSGRATTFDNCRIEGDIRIGFAPNTGSELNFGGLVAMNEADNLVLKNSVNKANIVFNEFRCDDEEQWDNIYDDWTVYFHANATCHIGGFIGWMYCGGKASTTTIDRCRNNGNITFSVDNAEGSVICLGGFIGQGDYAFIFPSTLFVTNCVNAGNLTIWQGNAGSSAYAAGFVAVDKINGHETVEGGGSHYAGYTTVPEPHFYNNLNKGDITVRGNDAHAAGFVFLDRAGCKFAICVNTGKISAVNSNGKAPYKAAISSGYGECRWCWWLEADRDHPELSCTLNGSATNCYCYPTLGQDTPNNRRRGVNSSGGQDIVLDQTNSHWTHQQWLDNTVPWTGTSKADGSMKSLDLDF